MRFLYRYLYKFSVIAGFAGGRAVLVSVLALAMHLSAGAPARAQGSAGPYVPTPTVIVDELLKLADIKRGEFVIDLGSGDGRIVITAAKRYGATGYGVDIEESLVDLARQNARKEGVAERVNFIAGDLFNSDLSKADVVTVYLLPSTVIRLVPKLLKELRPGARVVSHDYPLDPWVPEKVLNFNFEEKVMISGTTRTVLYRYIVPPRAAGR
ncbi:MAG: methyltransferase domain-containing protein [Betaproteobacteria bacterium]|nr:methyltransferase domain-containing protein [Betaproteobacteria bacterium]